MNRLSILLLVVLALYPGAVFSQCSLTCPANVTTSTSTEECTEVVNYPDPVPTGTCGVITCSTPSGSAFPVGNTFVQCDAEFGELPCSFSVFVIDGTPPVITCQDSVHVVASAPGSVSVNYPLPAASDACSTPSVECSPNQSSLFSDAVNIVQCTAIGEGGSVATCDQYVVILFDSDNDGVIDDIDGCPNDSSKSSPGTCGCGVAEADLNFNGAVDCDLGPELKARIGTLKKAVKKIKGDHTKPGVKGSVKKEAKQVGSFVSDFGASIPLSDDTSALIQNALKKVSAAVKSLAASDKSKALKALSACETSLS